MRFRYPSSVGTKFINYTCDKTPKLEFHLNQVALGAQALRAYDIPRTPLADPNPESENLRSLSARAGLWFGAMLDPSSDQFFTDPQMPAIFFEQFNMMEPGRQLKWSWVRPSADVFNFAPADQLITYAAQNGINVRGHTLAWDSFNPSWLANGTHTPAELEQILVTHIQTVMKRYRDLFPGTITSGTSAAVTRFRPTPR